MSTRNEPGNPSVRPRLLASYFTIAGNVLPITDDWSSPYPLRRRANAASRAGYVGIGLSVDDLERCIEQHGYSGIQSVLADCGIQYLELEMLMNWFADGPEREASDQVRRTLLEAAGALGAYQIKVGGGPRDTEVDLGRFINEFGELCMEAEQVGTQIGLELTIMCNVNDLPTGVAIVEGAGAANGGLLLDIWHVVRGHIAFDSIAALPPGCLKHVELNDASRQMIGSMIEDTIHRRRLPGEGNLDVAGFLKAIARSGYDGLYGVEIISDEFRCLTPEDAARDSHDATVRQFMVAGLPCS